MSFSISIGNRDFTSRLREPSQMMRVNNMTYSAIGGPKDASISVRGSETSLWETADWLRCPVLITDEAGDPVWWGFVNKVRIRVRALEIVLSLGMMGNRIMADYTHTPSGLTASESAETLWISNADSIAEYGTRECKYTFSNTSAEAAAQRLAVILEETKYPRISYSPSEATDSMSVLLECRGWWDTLNWIYYEDSSGVEEYVDTGTGVEHVGTTAKQVARESFALVTGTSTWKADTLYIRARKEEAPTDSLRLAITDAGGTVLAYGDLVGADLNTTLEWVSCPLNALVTLVAGTTYYVRVSRTGVLDNTNYYVIDVVAPPTYPRGFYTYWNGSAWVATTPDADMVFRVTGVEEVSAQISRQLLSAGQFFTSVNMMDTSGVYTNPYNDGEQTAKATVQALLETGTTNSKRLLARVHPNRSVEVYEEPAETSARMTLDSNNRVRTIIGDPIPKSRTPYGEWLRLADIIPASVNTAQMSNPDKMFIEELSYTVPVDDLTLTLKGTRRLSDIGSIDQG